MTGVRNQISFLLNDRVISLDAVPSALTLLDYLRLEQHLCGTKEGCAEGDCGACTVLIGRLSGSELIYETVNACIRFIGSLNGCHVVTVEHLKRSDGSLHPVQQAMVDHHGSQCGFCTPGIVMSLYGLWMASPNPTNAEVETALQGNLCRCTGYEPIVKAAQAVSSIDDPENDPLVRERKAVTKQLEKLRSDTRVEIEHDKEMLIVPVDLDDLAEARVSHPDSTIVAGSTDVGLWVTKHMRKISPVIFISHLAELKEITVADGGLTIGACVTYNELLPVLTKHLPQLTGYWNRIGGEQVRNMGTVGGNVANGSPIGDTPPVLIALDATVTLRCGDKRRTLPVEEFFIDYGKQDRIEGDFVETLHIPFPADHERFAAYKISKRFDEDISAVAIAFRLRERDGVVEDITIACGGMAATPKRAVAVEKMLRGKPWTEETIDEAIRGFDDDFTPLSDWRASAEYRSLVAKNLLRRFYLETAGGSENIRLYRDEAVRIPA